ncbi:MAG: GAF domain-containing sensor histidine kinase [Candidatus Rifleibacteriota bacterium]
MSNFYKDLLAVTAELNRGASLEEVLDHFYSNFKSHVPYDRIGVSIISDDKEMVKSIWARAEYDKLMLATGYQAKLAGSSLEKIVETKQPRIINDLEDYLKHKPESHSTRLVVKEGVRSSLTCPLIAEGEPIGFLFFSKKEKSTYKDAHIENFLAITEHLSLIVARIIALDNCRRLSDYKTKFLGIVSHDLRNPLALIQSYVDMLRDSELGLTEEKREHFFDRIKVVSKRMVDLINDLLDISAIESGQVKLEKEKLDLAKLLKDAAASHKYTAEKKDIKLLAEIPDKIPEVYADSSRINQVIDNFITNAVKFSPSDTEITLKVIEEQDYVRVSVTDQGQGIPKKEQGKLFQDFGKTSVRPTDGEKSTGLGLAIVKKIIAGHGGKVGAESEVGKGSTFYFTLPLP